MRDYLIRKKYKSARIELEHACAETVANRRRELEQVGEKARCAADVHIDDSAFVSRVIIEPGAALTVGPGAVVIEVTIKSDAHVTVAENAVVMD